MLEVTVKYIHVLNKQALLKVVIFIFNLPLTCKALQPNQIWLRQTHFTELINLNFVKSILLLPKIISTFALQVVSFMNIY